MHKILVVPIVIAIFLVQPLKKVFALVCHRLETVLISRGWPHDGLLVSGLKPTGAVLAWCFAFALGLGIPLLLLVLLAWVV